MRALVALIALLLLTACPTPEPLLVDEDGDGFPAGEDCDDTSADAFPGGVEVCDDGLDNDCDGTVDLVGDVDEDGSDGCEDCDDADASALPGGVEVCDDGVDNDCEGTIDLIGDSDGDGSDGCADCDDADATAVPGGVEVCGDNVDNDCEGTVDQVGDWDGDGSDGCEDCDDADVTIFPGATELCDAIDQDCDGDLLEAFIDTDSDGDPDCTDPDDDGDGDPDATDCADLDDSVYTGATEVVGDGIDQDCDGADTVECFADTDLDGFGGTAVLLAADGDCDDAGEDTASDDCDDADPAIHPGAAGLCDGIDVDCSTTLDSDEELVGDSADCAALDCLAVLTDDPAAPSDLYWIDPGPGPFEAWCDQVSTGGGWTRVARLDMATDGYCGGDPDPSFDLALDPSLSAGKLADAVVQAIVAASPTGEIMYWLGEAGRSEFLYTTMADPYDTTSAYDSYCTWTCADEVPDSTTCGSEWIGCGFGGRGTGGDTKKLYIDAPSGQHAYSLHSGGGFCGLDNRYGYAADIYVR